MAEYDFMLHLKTLIAKSATDAELNPVIDALRKAAPKIGDTITPKNRHCLKGKVDGKYIQWNEILRDVLNVKRNCSK